MSHYLLTLQETITENWIIIISLISIVAYGKWGFLPISRGYWCPNMVTLIGTIICLISFFGLLIHKSTFLIGTFIYTLGAISDLIDGRLARAYPSESKTFSSFKQAFFYGGKSDYGAIWDSSHDKAKVVPTYTYVSIIMFMNGEFFISLLFISIALIDLGSGIRKIKEFKQQLKSGNNHSKDIGKAKAWLQQLVFIPLFLISIVGKWALILSLIITLFLTVGSVVARFISKRHS